MKIPLPRMTYHYVGGISNSSYSFLYQPLWQFSDKTLCQNNLHINVLCSFFAKSLAQSNKFSWNFGFSIWHRKKKQLLRNLKYQLFKAGKKISIKFVKFSSFKSSLSIYELCRTTRENLISNLFEKKHKILLYKIQNMSLGKQTKLFLVIKLTREIGDFNNI